MPAMIYRNLEPLIVITIHFLTLRNICGLKLTMRGWFAGIFCSSILLFLLINVLDLGIFTTPAVCFCMFLFLVFYRTNIIISLFYSSLTGYVVLFIAHIITAFFIYNNEARAFALGNIYFSYLLYGAVFCFISPLSRLIGKRLERILNTPAFSVKGKFPRNVLMAISIISQFILALIYVDSLLSAGEERLKSSVIASFIFLLLMTVLLITIAIIFNGIFIRDIKFKYELELSENMREFNASIQNLYDRMERYRHDMLNIFTATQGYISNEDFEGWKEYFETHIVPAHKPIFDYDKLIKKVDKVEIASLKGLLLVKLVEAYEKKVILLMDISGNINGEFKNILDINRIIGIFLDNALDECCKKEGMKIKFAMYNHENQVTVLVINELHGEPPDLARMFERNVTTKGTGRGIGLYNAQQIVKSNKDMVLQTSIRDGEICQELTIKLGTGQPLVTRSHP